MRQSKEAWKPTCSSSLSDGSGIRQCAKCDFLACLEDVSQPRSESSATLHCTRLGSDRSDAETSQTLQRVRTGGLHALHLIKVSANYATRPSVGPLPATPLKGTTRAKRGKAVRRRVVGCASIPGNGPASSESMTRSCSISCLAPYSTPSNLQTNTTAPDQVDEDATHTIERFVVLLYDRTSTSKRCRHLNGCLLGRTTSSWYHRQVRPWSSMSNEPCTRAGMSRVRLCFLHQHCSPRPTGADSRRATRHTSLTGQHSMKLVSCKCQKGCTKKCKCKKANLECTQLCACDGEGSRNWTRTFEGICLYI